MVVVVVAATTMRNNDNDKNCPGLKEHQKERNVSAKKNANNPTRQAHVFVVLWLYKAMLYTKL
jgi:hypothetical protein